MAKMIERTCECCKTKFLARQADVNRGWAKFCSKSCKAIKQEKQTGQYANYLNRRVNSNSFYHSDFDDLSWDAHKNN